MLTFKKISSPRSKPVLVSQEAYDLVLEHSTFEDTFASALDRLLKVTPTSAPPSVSPNLETHTATGTTKQHLFEQPILDALKELGGKARNSEVLAKIESVLPLTVADRTPNAKGIIPWRERAAWCVSKLRKDGSILPSKQEGVWELPFTAIPKAE